MHERSPRVDPKTGALQELLRRPGLPGAGLHATRTAGSPAQALRAVRPRGRDQSSALAQEHVLGTRTPIPTAGTRSSTRDRVTADGSAIPLTAARGVGQRRLDVDMTQAMDNGPKERIMDVAVWVSRQPRPAWSRSPASPLLSSAAMSPRSASPPTAPVANGGRSKSWLVINKVTSSAGEVYQAPEEGPPGAPKRHQPGRELSQAGHRQEHLSFGSSPPPQGPAKRSADGDVLLLRWLVGYTPQLATAVPSAATATTDLGLEPDRARRTQTPATYGTILRRGVPHQDLDQHDADVTRRRPGRAVPAAGERRGHQERPRAAPFTPEPTPTQKPTKKPSLPRRPPPPRRPPRPHRAPTPTPHRRRRRRAGQIRVHGWRRRERQE